MQKYLNHVFVAELVLFFLIIFGVVPRQFAFALAGILIVYSLLASTEDATVLFVRSIPLFIALPITQNFDNFNTWRIIAIIIFIKFLIFNFKFSIKSKFSILLIILLAIAILSVFVAQDQIIAIKRIIYFINLSLVPIVIYYLPNRERILRNLAVPAIIVTVFGFFQLILTYFVDIYQFMDIFGNGIQCRQFGMEWCRIVTFKGNTWFAYYGEQLSLRMFSLFTDSHTFPVFLLLSLPALYALKSRWKWLIISFIFLAIILSGTRGIWAASIPIALLAILFRKRVPARSLIIFFALFFVAWPIFNSPQFLLAHGDFRHRIKSVFDFDETSNKARIAIWKASIVSIRHHPFLGVGIGNFPVVLRENLELSKAGSSAHNLYLHVAAEMGIFALAALIWFLWLVIHKLYALRFTLYDPYLLFLPWVLLYVLTDVALFDERAFLITATVIALILSSGQHQSSLS